MSLRANCGSNWSASIPCTGRKCPRAPANHTRCACGSQDARKTCAKRSGSATRSRRSIPTARPRAAVRGNRRATWWRALPCCWRAHWQSRKSGSWGRKMKLREIAHSRTGDKGNISNISVIAYDAKHYPLLLEQVTAARVKSHFAGVVQGEVVRYELPNLSALNFVMDQALGGGVTRSLALDAHGKSLSSALLDLDISTAPDGKKQRERKTIMPATPTLASLAADLAAG